MHPRQIPQWSLEKKAEIGIRKRQPVNFMKTILVG